MVNQNYVDASSNRGRVGRAAASGCGVMTAQIGYGLQAPSKTVEAKQHSDRNARFDHINAQATDCLKRGVPFISVDTKKKELVGNFKNAGREWQPQDGPEVVDVHDFPSDAVGKAISYGVYDVAANNAFVGVGTDHDTPVFAVTSIEAWWTRMGAQRYPNARELFITADVTDRPMRSACDRPSGSSPDRPSRAS